MNQRMITISCSTDEANKLSLALTWDQLQKALDEIGLKTPVECERSVSLDLPHCKPTSNRQSRF